MPPKKNARAVAVNNRNPWKSTENGSDFIGHRPLSLIFDFCATGSDDHDFAVFVKLRFVCKSWEEIFHLRLPTFSAVVTDKLWKAVKEKRSADFAAVLIRWGASANAVRPLDKTTHPSLPLPVLHFAVLQGDAKLVEELLKQGARVDNVAIWSTLSRSLQTFGRFHSNMDADDFYGHGTALSLAVTIDDRSQRIKIMQLLLNRRAKTQITLPSRHVTLLHSSKKMQVIEYTPLRLAIARCDMDVVDLLVRERGLSVLREQNNNQMTALHYLAVHYWQTHEKREKMTFILDNKDFSALMHHLLKLDPSLLNSRDSQGRTPLHLAKSGYVVNQLSSYPEIEINAQDCEGQTVLHHIAQRAAEGLKELHELGHPDGPASAVFAVKTVGERARQLIKLGADPLLKDKSGKKAIDYYNRDCSRVQGYVRPGRALGDEDFIQDELVDALNNKVSASQTAAASQAQQEANEKKLQEQKRVPDAIPEGFKVMKKDDDENEDDLFYAVPHTKKKNSKKK